MEGNQKQKLKWLIKKTSSLISQTLIQLQQYYEDCFLKFQLEVQYLHKLMMSILVPIQLKVPDSPEIFKYFKTTDKKIQINNTRKPTTEIYDYSIVGLQQQEYNRVQEEERSSQSQQQYSQEEQKQPYKVQKNPKMLQKQLYLWTVNQILNGKQIKRAQIQMKAQQIYRNPSLSHYQSEMKSFYLNYPILKQYFQHGRQYFLNKLGSQPRPYSKPIISNKKTLTRMQARKYLEEWGKSQQYIESFINYVDKHNKNCIPVDQLNRIS